MLSRPPPLKHNMSSHWLFHATLFAFGSCEQKERKHDECAMNIRTVLVISNLEEKFLGVDVVDKTSVVLIHHCQSKK